MKLIGTTSKADIQKIDGLAVLNDSILLDDNKEYIISTYVDYNLPISLLEKYKDKKIVYEFEKSTRENNIDFAFSTPVTSFTELNNYIDLGVSYVYVAEPLSFSLNFLPVDKVKIVVKPTLSSYVNLPKANMLHTQWIRPEDVKYYEDYVYALDFSNEPEDIQDILIDVYRKGVYDGDISDLFSQLPRLRNFLLEGVGEKRRFCGLRCESSHTCHICDRLFYLPELKEKTKDAIHKFNEKLEEYSDGYKEDASEGLDERRDSEESIGTN